MKFKMGPSEVYVTTTEETSGAQSEQNRSLVTAKL